jgi:hypothetical protein
MAQQDPPHVFPIAFQPGVKRDGTQLEGNNCIDSLWCRFQRGLPRKMGGWREMTNTMSGPVRGCLVWSQSGLNYIYAGSGSALEYITVNSNGLGSAANDYTPGGFTASASNVWQLDAMWNAAGSNTALIAHGAPNLVDIDNATAAPVYYGPVDGTGSMTTTGKSVSGGAVCLHPFLFLFGSNGEILWSDENQPTVWTGGSSGSARVTATKIVKGFELRGGPSNSPAGIFWALDTVFRASYVGGTAIFSFDTISNQTSVLSSSGMIEYDGLFFWPGVDRFYVYNGVIQEVENNYNINYFFDNLNWTYRQKVWATKVPRWGEIWFFYPHGDSVECNNALIFNIRERVWYDAGLNAPGATRSAGYFSQVFRFPAWFGTTASDVDKYQAMQHESGTDAVVGGTSNAVRSYFETPDISLLTEGPMQSRHIGEDRQLKIERIELDFVQTGDMTVEYRGKAYPRSADVDTSETFSPTDEYLSPREQRRFLRLRFGSNVAGGDYQMGKPLIHLKTGDKRP